MDADEREKMLNIMFALNEWIVGEPFADEDGRFSRSWANFWHGWYSPSDDPNRFVKNKVFVEPPYQVNDPSFSPLNPTYQVNDPSFSPLNSRSGYQMIPWNIESLEGGPMPDWFYLLDHPSWGKVLIVSVLMDADQIGPTYPPDYPFMVWFYEDGPNQQFVQIWSEEDFQMNMSERGLREWLIEGKLYMITDWKELTDQTLLNWIEVPETLLE